MAKGVLRIREEKSEPLTSLTRVVMRPSPGGGLEVVRQHFEGRLVGESVIESRTTLEWASTAMEEAYEKEITERREAEGW
jgi:hypothetical protein